MGFETTTLTLICGCIKINREHDFFMSSSSSSIKFCAEHLKIKNEEEKNEITKKNLQRYISKLHIEQLHNLKKGKLIPIKKLTIKTGITRHNLLRTPDLYKALRIVLIKKRYYCDENCLEFFDPKLYYHY